MVKLIKLHHFIHETLLLVTLPHSFTPASCLLFNVYLMFRFISGKEALVGVLEFYFAFLDF